MQRAASRVASMRSIGSFSLIDQILAFCPGCFTKQIFRFNSDFFLSHLVILARFEL